MRVAKGRLTSWERTHLLKRPCVIKGCKSESEQQEHFPPKKFLRRHFDVITNRHLVWSICEFHNGQTKGFIMRLPADAPMPPNTLIITDGTDPMRLYSAAANTWITRYYAASKENDSAAAIHSFRMVIGLGKAIALLPENTEPLTFKPSQQPIRTKGKHAYSPHDSQLSFRQLLR